MGILKLLLFLRISVSPRPKTQEFIFSRNLIIVSKIKYIPRGCNDLYQFRQF
jgi:hypothetical protein